MPFYESVFLTRQDVSAQHIASLTETFSGIIKENGGEVPKTEYWGLRNLAYPIKKNRKAHYVLLNIDGPTAAVQEMERNMRLNEDVIRFMSLRLEALEEEPSVMMRNKAAREERSRRDERHRGPPREGAARQEKEREAQGEAVKGKEKAGAAADEKQSKDAKDATVTEPDADEEKGASVQESEKKASEASETSETSGEDKSASDKGEEK